MNEAGGNSGLGSALVILRLVIARNGLIWVLTLRLRPRSRFWFSRSACPVSRPKFSIEGSQVMSNTDMPTMPKTQHRFFPKVDPKYRLLQGLRTRFLRDLGQYS